MCTHDVVIEYNNVILVIAVFSLDPSTKSSEVMSSKSSLRSRRDWRILLKKTSAEKMSGSMAFLTLRMASNTCRLYTTVVYVCLSIINGYPN